MNTTSKFQKSIISGITLAALGVAAFAGIGGEQEAHAADKLRKYEIQYQLSESNSVPAGGTFTLTFNGQTTTPGKEGGRYEYEWKVEEGESLIKPIDGLKSEVDVPDYGREGGNVEYEWKVEEGES